MTNTCLGHGETGLTGHTYVVARYEPGAEDVADRHCRLNGVLKRGATYRNVNLRSPNVFMWNRNLLLMLRGKSLNNSLWECEKLRYQRVSSYRAVNTSPSRPESVCSQNSHVGFRCATGNAPGQTPTAFNVSSSQA